MALDGNKIFSILLILFLYVFMSSYIAVSLRVGSSLALVFKQQYLSYSLKLDPRSEQ